MSNLSEEDKAKTRAVVRALCDSWQKQNEGSTLKAFADRADVPYTGGLLRWRSGKHTPSAKYLIRLIDVGGLVGLLDEAEQSRDGQPADQNPLAELRETVEANLDLTQKVESRLAAVEQILRQEAAERAASAADKTRREIGP